MSCTVDTPFVLTSGDGQAGESDQPVILYLTITVSANPTSRSILSINTTNTIETGVDISSMEQATEATIAHLQDSIETTPFVVAVANTPGPFSPPTDPVPVETSTPLPPEPDVQAAMSPAKDALQDADEATKAINLTSTWEGAVERIKWVIDTVNPVAGVRHNAISFYYMFD